MLAVLLIALRHWRSVSDIAHRVRVRPLLILPLFASSALLGVQVWLFTWAPLNGRGLQVALGYFMLPLVLVVIGRFLYRDRLAWWHWLAAGIAAAGVAFEIARVGGIGWDTLLVALGYPAYFVLRRALGTGSLGGMLWEMALMAPFAVAFIVREIAFTGSLQENPALLWMGPLIAAWAGAALILYVSASRLLTLSVFGLLSYLEPALLMVAALLYGERIASAEWTIYLTIWIAVLVLLAGGIVTLVRSRPAESG